MASNPSLLPSYTLKAFSLLMFKSCPLLHDLVPQHAQIWTSFMQYKERVPVCGAVLINEWWDKVRPALSSSSSSSSSSLPHLVSPSPDSCRTRRNRSSSSRAGPRARHGHSLAARSTRRSPRRCAQSARCVGPFSLAALAAWLALHAVSMS